MYSPKDIFDNEICPGDVIVYSVKHSTWVETHIAVVKAVVYEDTDIAYKRYSLKVTAFKSSKWDGNAIYNTTLTSNQTIIRLNNFTFPQGFKDLLRL